MTSYRTLKRVFNKEKFLRKYFSPDIYFWEWVVVAAVIFMTIISSAYQDTRSLTVWSVNVWDVIWERRPLEFYEYTAQNLHNIRHQYMGCDLFAIIPLSIWNLPIWIAQRFMGKDVADNAYLLAWSKLGLEACSVFIAYMGYKMAFLVTNDKKRSMWAMLLTLGASSSVIAVGIAGQTDVFVVAYGALCVYNMMKGNQRYAVLFAALSIAVKPFFIFAFLPLVLLVEKNIFRAALNCGLSLSIMVLNRLIGNLFPLYKESMNQGPSILVLTNLFGVEIAKMSIFMIGLLVLCFLSYMATVKSDKERYVFCIYIAAGVFMLMSAFSKTEFYRSVLIMPYFSVLIISDMDRLRLNMMIGFLYQLFHTIIRSTASGNTISAYYMQGSVFSRIFAPSESAKQAEANTRAIILSVGENEQFYNLVTNVSAAVVAVSIVLLLILNYPRFKHKFDIEESGCFAKFDHGILMLNALVFLPFLMLMYLIYFMY